MPEDDRCNSRTMSGAAIDTMVWSMKVMATANIIAASATVCCCGADREGGEASPRPGRVLLTHPVCAGPCHVASQGNSGPARHTDTFKRVPRQPLGGVRTTSSAM
ncbi:hypothetical protein GCM10010303_01130 [Streptomyces purpurascens]|nr:hypothetical protein GCM10010303_01130 [Streptomyces purpurascens]